MTFAFEVCTAHRTANGGGHDHVFPAPVERRTSGSRCPFCTSKQVCAGNSLAFLRKDLADEWHQPLNGTLTPDQVSPGMGREVYWECLKNPLHEPYPQGIARRALDHKRCPDCADDDARARERKTTNASSQDQRDRARRQRPVRLPPVLDATASVVADDTAEPMATIHEVAVALNRSDQTIRNWVRDHRIRSRPLTYVAAPIPRSEIGRLQQILDRPPAPSSNVAA